MVRREVQGGGTDKDKLRGQRTEQFDVLLNVVRFESDPVDDAVEPASGDCAPDLFRIPNVRLECGRPRWCLAGMAPPVEVKQLVPLPDRFV